MSDLLEWGSVLAWRMRRQHLLPRTCAGVVALARDLCGVQAQVTSAAELAVAVRADRPAPSGITAALERRELVKTWAMRGTLHLLAADVLPAYLALSGANRQWETTQWRRRFVHGRTLTRLTDAVLDALDGRVLTREELADAVLAATGDAEIDAALRSGWAAALKPLAWRGMLCFGPPKGNRVTFARLDQWLPGTRGLPAPEEAAHTVLPAYLRAFGPARVADVDQWLSRGLNGATRVRSWLAGLDGVAEVRVAGQRRYAMAADVDEIAATRPTDAVRLLPGFDQYVLGPGTGAEQVVPKAVRARVSRPGGWISPVVVSGGRVVGVWEPSGERVEVRLFDGPDSVPAAALAAEVAEVTARVRVLARGA